MNDFHFKKLRHRRNWKFYIFLFLITIALGLLSRSSIPIPIFLATYAGDTLWALMVYWGLCILFLKTNPFKIALLALLFSFVIEFSQLYHAPWIDAIRDFKLGGLVLGYGFKYSDLICYTVGIVLGTTTDYYIQKFR